MKSEHLTENIMCSGVALGFSKIWSASGHWTIRAWLLQVPPCTAWVATYAVYQDCATVNQIKTSYWKEESTKDCFSTHEPHILIYELVDIRMLCAFKFDKILFHLATARGAANCPAKQGYCDVIFFFTSGHPCQYQFSFFRWLCFHSWYNHLLFSRNIFHVLDMIHRNLKIWNM